MDVNEFDKAGGYDPYKLDWGEVVCFPSTRNLNEYGNRIYNRYPARSIFLVPRATIFSKKQVHKVLNILDPFMGSGTTAVEASLFGSNIYGTEMDPFAKMIAEVSLYRFSKREEKELIDLFRAIKEAWGEYPVNQNLYPDLKNIEYWFSEDNFNDLLRLKSFIYENIKKEKFLKFFKVTFADCIKPASRMERQSTKPYISSKYPKKIKAVFESFEYSFNAHLKALKQYCQVEEAPNKIEIIWLGNDATNFKAKSNSIDLAITSPPYLNAFDYTQIIKIESSWVGTLLNENISSLRKIQVGNEKRKDNDVDPFIEDIFSPYFNKIIQQGKVLKKDNNKTAKTCRAYFCDIKKNLECVRASLKKGGEYHMIIGDNTIKNVKIPTHKLIAKIAEKVGFNWFGYYKYVIKDHRTSIPRKDKGGKINYEYVLMLKKP